MANSSEIDIGRGKAYHEWLGPILFEPWGKDLVARAEPKNGDRVLDLACGTGVVTRLVAEAIAPSGTVTGIDMDPGYLKVARSVPPPDGTAIEWHEGNALDLPFSDDSFDMALCQHGLQFFQDRSAALSETRRVLRSGSKIKLSVWRDIEFCPGFHVLEQALERHGGPMENKPLTCSLGDQDELRQLAEEAGFRDVQVERVSMTTRAPSAERWTEIVAAAGPAIGRAVAGLDDRAKPAMLEEVKKALASYMKDGELAIPFEAHILTAYT